MEESLHTHSLLWTGTIVFCFLFQVLQANQWRERKGRKGEEKEKKWQSELHRRLDNTHFVQRCLGKMWTEFGWSLARHLNAIRLPRMLYVHCTPYTFFFFNLISSKLFFNLISNSLIIIIFFSRWLFKLIINLIPFELGIVSHTGLVHFLLCHEPSCEFNKLTWANRVQYDVFSLFQSFRIYPSVFYCFHGWAWSG